MSEFFTVELTIIDICVFEGDLYPDEREREGEGEGEEEENEIDSMRSKDETTRVMVITVECIDVYTHIAMERLQPVSTYTLCENEKEKETGTGTGRHRERDRCVSFTLLLSSRIDHN